MTRQLFRNGDTEVSIEQTEFTMPSSKLEQMRVHLEDTVKAFGGPIQQGEDLVEAHRRAAVVQFAQLLLQTFFKE